MKRSACNFGTTAAICLVAMQVFLSFGVSASFSEELRTPPAPELQVNPFRTFGTGVADASAFAINPPDGLAFTGDGLLLATDAMNYRVQVFDPYTDKHVGSAGDAGFITGEVVDIAVLPDKSMLASDEKANQIYRFARTSISPAVFQPVLPPLFKNEGFARLCGIGCDAKGRVYVVDGVTGEVRRYLPDLNPDPAWQFQQMRPDKKPFLNRAEGIAFDERSGDLFLSSERDGMIQAFDLETGKWQGRSIGRGVDPLTGSPLGRSVFNMSVEGLAVIDGYLLAVDEGEDDALKKEPGHLLIFDLRSPAVYRTNAESCLDRMANGVVDGLVGWFGSYLSPDSVAVFPGNSEHPEALVAVADQGSYKVVVYKWEDIKKEIMRLTKNKKIV